MFVNAHLAAHSEKLLEREEQFCAIDKQLRELLLENKASAAVHNFFLALSLRSRHVL